VAPSPAGLRPGDGRQRGLTRTPGQPGALERTRTSDTRFRKQVAQVASSGRRANRGCDLPRTVLLHACVPADPPSIVRANRRRAYEPKCRFSLGRVRTRCKESEAWPGGVEGIVVRLAFRAGPDGVVPLGLTVLVLAIVGPDGDVPTAGDLEGFRGTHPSVSRRLPEGCGNADGGVGTPISSARASSLRVIWTGSARFYARSCASCSTTRRAKVMPHDVLWGLEQVTPQTKGS
jgi:hypothetical protein